MDFYEINIMNRTLLMVVVAAGVGDAALLTGEAELVPPIGVLEGLGLVGIAPVAKVGVSVHDFHVSMVLKMGGLLLFDRMLRSDFRFWSNPPNGSMGRHGN